MNAAQDGLKRKLEENLSKLQETQWTKTFQELAELRKPIQKTIDERMKQIEAEGKRLKATGEEIEKIKQQELKKIKEMYGMDADGGKPGSQSAGAALAVAGSIDAWNITMRSQQDKVVSEIKKIDQNVHKSLTALNKLLERNGPICNAIANVFKPPVL